MKFILYPYRGLEGFRMRISGSIAIRLDIDKGGMMWLSKRGLFTCIMEMLSINNIALNNIVRPVMSK